MTEVYIDQQRVFFKENTNLKLTIENTFFEDAGSYTLDVVFPLTIEQNRRVFGAINRIDVSKRYQTFDAMIVVDSKLVFKGTAKITNINDSEVKLQLLSGNSHVKFRIKAQKMYIDDLAYEYTDNRTSFDHYVNNDAFGAMSIFLAGTFPGKKGLFCYVPILDENGGDEGSSRSNGLLNEHFLMINNDEWNVIIRGYDVDHEPVYIEMTRNSICPNLMFVFRWIVGHLGYTIRRNDRDSVFLNSIYIATARRTTVASNNYNMKSSSEEKAMAKALPHWTVEEFIKQLQNFLNATIIFDDLTGTVDIISDTFTDGVIDITDSVEDEYEVEVIDDEDVEANLYDSNVNYKEGASDYHDIDMVDSEVIKTFTEVKCTYDQFLAQWGEMSDSDKKITIWTTEKGQYCAKINVDEHGNETLERIRFNHFGGIVRNTANDNDIELKISPVATTKEIDMHIYTYYTTQNGARIYMGDPKATCKQTVLCLQNQYEAANKSTVWDAINGEHAEESPKEDIMQVFLMDDKAIPSGYYHLTFQTPFTHCNYNLPNNSVIHSDWSLSLANDNTSHNIGKLHITARTQNRNAEHRIKFLADKIPSVYSIFIVRNKRYACKKIEVQFDARGMNKEINGYFEEIL